MAEFLDKQMNLGLKLETAWDTAPSVDATLYLMAKAIPGSVVINPNTDASNINYTSSTGVYEESDRKHISNAGVIPSIEFEVYATPEFASRLFRLALLDQDTGGLVDLEPVNGIIDFPAGGGVVGSIIAWTQAGDGVSLKNAIVDSLTFSMDNVGSGESRLGKIAVKCVGTVLTTGLTITNVTAGSTETTDYIVNSSKVALDDFTLNMSVTGTAFSETDLCWRRYILTIANNIISDCIVEHVPANFRRVNPTIEHTIDIPHNDATTGFLTYFKSGNEVVFTLTNGIGITTAGYWKLQNGGDAYILRPPAALEGQMQSNSIVIREMYDGTSWNPIVSIVHLSF